MLCLSIGLILGIKGCGTTLSSWSFTIDYVFVNQTDYLLEFKIWSNYEDGTYVPLDKQVRTISIVPQSTSTTFSIRDSGPEKLDAALGRYGFVRTLLGPSEVLHGVFSMLIDNITCAVFDGVGFALPSNYEYEVLGNRHIKYIYTFTDADFENLVECDE
jgi:hypothetical protein